MWVVVVVVVVGDDDDVGVGHEIAALLSNWLIHDKEVTCWNKTVCNTVI